MLSLSSVTQPTKSPATIKRQANLAIRAKPLCIVDPPSFPNHRALERLLPCDPVFRVHPGKSRASLGNEPRKGALLLLSSRADYGYQIRGLPPTNRSRASSADRSGQPVRPGNDESVFRELEALAPDRGWNWRWPSHRGKHLARGHHFAGNTRRTAAGCLGRRPRLLVTASPGCLGLGGGPRIRSVPRRVRPPRFGGHHFF